jgi:hypothetical protein
MVRSDEAFSAPIFQEVSLYRQLADLVQNPQSVIRDRVEPAASPAMSATLRLRPIFAVQPNIAMCQWATTQA